MFIHGDIMKKITQTNAFRPDDPISEKIAYAENVKNIRKLSDYLLVRLEELLQKISKKYCKLHGDTEHEVRFVCKRCEAENVKNHN